jgi:hypothetical protein
MPAQFFPHGGIACYPMGELKSIFPNGVKIKKCARRVKKKRWIFTVHSLL